MVPGLIVATCAALGLGGWWYLQKLKRQRTALLLEIMGDHDVPTEVGTLIRRRSVGSRSEAETWTYARADLPDGWKDFEAVLGDPRVSDAGVDPLVFTDPREIGRLVCWSSQIDVHQALEDDFLRGLIWAFLARGGAIGEGYVRMEVPEAQDAMGMASLQSDVADMASRLKLALG